MKKIILVVFGLIVMASSCYRMPEEGEVSVLPIVNNPTTIRSTPSPVVTPGIEY